MIPALGATNQLKKDRQNASHEKNSEHLVQLQVQLNLWTSLDNIYIINTNKDRMERYYLTKRAIPIVTIAVYQATLDRPAGTDSRTWRMALKGYPPKQVSSNNKVSDITRLFQCNIDMSCRRRVRNENMPTNGETPWKVDNDKTRGRTLGIFSISHAGYLQYSLEAPRTNIPCKVLE